MKYNKGILNKFMNKAVAVALETQAEWDQLMELLEKDTEVQWSSGKKPTQSNAWHVYDNKTKVACIGENEMRFGSNSFEKENYEIVKFKDLVDEEEMSVEDKLKFLAERAADGKEFYMGNIRHSLNNGECVLLPSGIKSKVRINELVNLDLELVPQWKFTEDEKAILRNLPKEYKWIARDKDGDVLVYDNEPTKRNTYWLRIFNHLFQSIQWSDKEPCEFRKYI